MLAKNADPDEYGNSGYGIRFHARSQFSLSIDEWGKNVVIFGVENSSPRHTNRKNDILVLGEGPKDGLNDTAITVEAKYSGNITKSRKKVCLSLYYNATNKFLYNGVKIYQLKAKGSEIKQYPLCLGNASKDFTVDNMIKIGLRGYVYHFSIDCNTSDTSDIADIHKYLKKKFDIVKLPEFIKKGVLS